MVDNGARKIGLLSRSNSMSSEVHVLTEDMVALGAEIFLLPCDVTDKLQLQQVVDQCATERGTIRGVINAAMVFKVCSTNLLTCYWCVLVLTFFKGRRV